MLFRSVVGKGYLENLRTLLLGEIDVVNNVFTDLGDSSRAQIVGAALEVVAEGGERGDRALHAPQGRRGCAPRSRGPDEPQRLGQIAAQLAREARTVARALSPRRDPLACHTERDEAIDEPIDRRRRDAS